MFKSAPYLLLVGFAETSVPIYLYTNAPTYALGGELLIHVDGSLGPVAYYNQKSSTIECNYNISDRELLAIRNCLRYFLYCLSYKFKVCTDCKLLLYDLRNNASQSL